MTAQPASPSLPRPLVLGASGRIGRAFRQLQRAGVWPGPPPVWQQRRAPDLPDPDVLVWDILNAPPPDLPRVQGIIVLAGPTPGGDLSRNSALALAALNLARQTGCGPVLLTSSSAVYGRQDGAVPETASLTPLNAYGVAKSDMEQAAGSFLQACGPTAPPACILRIGNVAGADVILQAAARGPVTLDRFADGHGPARSYIGMLDLARVMVGLVGLQVEGASLPAVLNVAAAPPVAMADLLQAAGLGWTWQQAPVAAIRQLTLDTGLLDATLPDIALSGDPADMIAQARLSGWRPA